MRRRNLIGTGWLGQMMVEATGHCALDIVVRAPAGEGDQSDVPGVSLGTELLRHLITIDVRQPDVEE